MLSILIYVMFGKYNTNQSNLRWCFGA